MEMYAQGTFRSKGHRRGTLTTLEKLLERILDSSFLSHVGITFLLPLTISDSLRDEMNNPMPLWMDKYDRYFVDYLLIIA